MIKVLEALETPVTHDVPAKNGIQTIQPGVHVLSGGANTKEGGPDAKAIAELICQDYGMQKRPEEPEAQSSLTRQLNDDDFNEILGPEFACMSSLRKDVASLQTGHATLGVRFEQDGSGRLLGGNSAAVDEMLKKCAAKEPDSLDDDMDVAETPAFTENDDTAPPIGATDHMKELEDEPPPATVTLQNVVEREDFRAQFKDMGPGRSSTVTAAADDIAELDHAAAMVDGLKKGMVLHVYDRMELIPGVEDLDGDLQNLTELHALHMSSKLLEEVSQGLFAKGLFALEEG